MTTTPAEDFDRSDAVFRGRVTHIGFHWFSSTEPVTFAVEQSWKGVDSNQAVVYAAPSQSEGYRFQSGETYLVYAHLSDGKFYTSGCSKTSLLKDASPQLNDLSGRNVVPITKIVSNEGSANIVWIISGSVLLLLAIGYTVHRLIQRAA